MTSALEGGFTRIQQNIILRLIAYYLAMLVVAIALWRFLPAGLHARLDAAMQQLVGQVVDTGESLKDATNARQALPPSTVLLVTSIAGVTAFLLALPVSWVYMFTRQKKGYSQSVVHSLVLLPIVVAMIAALVRNSIALAFSLAGVVAAVRFRTTLDDSKDAVYVFVAAALGLACGVQLEVGVVLSVLWSIIVLGLWYTDFARTPPSLEGARAEQHMQRAMKIANRTSQFVARLDRELLETMAPAQLDALRMRVEKRQSELDEKDKKKKKNPDAETGDEEGPRFDGRLTIVVSDPDAAQPAVEALFETHLKRWKVIRLEREDGVGRLVYAVRPKKGHTLEEVAANLERDGAPYVSKAEVEKWA